MAAASQMPERRVRTGGTAAVSVELWPRERDLSAFFSAGAVSVAVLTVVLS